MMAEGVVDVYRCGTYATGWLARDHPKGNDYVSYNLIFFEL